MRKSMKAPLLMAALIGACSGPLPDDAGDLAVLVVLEDMAALDLAVELPPSDFAVPAELGSSCTTMVGQPCCAATPEEAATLPAPPGTLPKGAGRCSAGQACASASCAPRTMCADGSYNGTSANVYVIYCVKLQS